jgi:hypothetical protein
MSSEMAEPKINVEDPRLDSSTDGDEDGPDARQQRRERREAKKSLVADESVLDESDEESEASHMEQEEIDAAPPAPTGDGARAAGDGDRWRRRPLPPPRIAPLCRRRSSDPRQARRRRKLIQPATTLRTQEFLLGI